MADAEAKPKVVVPAGATVVSVLMATLLWGSWKYMTGPTEGVGGPSLSLEPLAGVTAPARSGSWGPDERELVFDRMEGEGVTLSIAVPDEGRVRPLDAGTDVVGVPRWSPDGTRIAFLAAEGGGVGLRLVSPGGGATVTLVETGLDVTEAEASRILGGQPWSPDGRRLVVSRRESDARPSLWLVDVEGGAPVRLTEGTNGADLAASWSGDGAWIAFHRVTAGAAPRLHRVPAAGGETEAVDTGAGGATDPVWVAADTRLLFIRPAANGGGDLWETDIARGGPRPLTTGGEAGPPTVSADGLIVLARQADGAAAPSGAGRLHVIEGYR